MPTGMPEPTYPTNQLDVLRHEFGFVAFAEYGTKSYGIARKALEEVARLRAELSARVEAESADAAAGSYAGRAEAAEARAQYLDEEALRLQRTIDEARKQRDDWHDEATRQRTRAEQAEAALAEMRETIATQLADLGDSRARNAHTTGPLAVVDRVQADTYRTAAWLIRNPDQFRVEVPRTALERAADEQGVRPVRDISELGAGDDGPTPEEFAAFDAARREGGG